MDIKDIFKSKKTVLSAEIFPPRKELVFSNIDKVIDELTSMKIDFISVTYGAGASNASSISLDVAKRIKSKGVEPLLHLTAHSVTKEMLDEYIVDLRNNDINNVLALRGDDLNDDTEFLYAADLVKYFHNKDFSIAGACYPEGHKEAVSFDIDIDYLKQKVDAGCDFLITQLFYNNEDFYFFRDKCRAIGINIPITCGIMPIVNKKQIDRIVSMAGAKIPLRLRHMMEKFKDNPKALEEAGIAYMIDQIIDLIVNDVDGIHIYVMNKPRIYKKLLEGISNILLDIDSHE